MQTKDAVLRRCTEFLEAAEESGLESNALDNLFQPLFQAIKDYYNDDISKPVQDALTALMHGILREGFKYDRPVTYKPCGNPPLGWKDVTVLFEHEDSFYAQGAEALVASIKEVLPTAGDTTEDAPVELVYESDVIADWIDQFKVRKALVRSSLKFIAQHGNATHIVSGLESNFGGAVLLSAPSSDDIKNEIYNVRKYKNLIDCRGLSVQVY